MFIYINVWYSLDVSGRGTVYQVDEFITTAGDERDERDHDDLTQEREAHCVPYERARYSERDCDGDDFYRGAHHSASSGDATTTAAAAAATDTGTFTITVALPPNVVDLRRP